ncbi:hypothetical protein FRC14_004928 [Serendipita sp. 396]|nr:hypothetical protein FRC14_004928 [Serendipita sp. 396]KAG8800879.1 hypothetical protein FRC16_001858 [Serendipita sp. 398]KAG8868966.1 hypothetical protein FRC20_002418 [Serendipita sp. 405]
MASPGPPTGGAGGGGGNPFAHATPPGGIPNTTDTILASIFIPLFFAVGLYFHFRLFKAYNQKFIWSILCFGFCMARIAALSLRLATVKHPTNKSLNIAAQVFIAAGVVLLFFVNLQMARRFFGQLHPQHAIWVKRVVNTACILVLPVLAMVITTVVQSFLTTDPSILDKDRKVRLVASVFLVLLAFLPIPIVLVVLLLQRLTPSPTPSPGAESGLEKGQVVLAEGDADPEADNDAVAATSNGKPNGIEKKEEGLTGCEHERERVKGEPTTGFGRTPVGQREIWETALVILIPGVLLTFEQGIRTSQAFYTPKVGRSPPWYLSKATFWTCIFAFELVSVLIFGLAVLPRRFSHLKII